MPTRIALAACGIALGLYGAYRILTQVHGHTLFVLGVWLVGAVVIHDGILSPAIVTLGYLLGRFVPRRARRYLQAALIMAGLVTIVAIPLIHRRGTQPRVKALLLQNYGGNLTLLLSIIAAVTLAIYAVHVARDRAASGTQPDAARSDND
jgi:hypothetical protein